MYKREFYRRMNLSSFHIFSSRYYYVKSKPGCTNTKALGYKNSGQDRRRRLKSHRYKYLVWGSIPADDYRILAVFPGDGPERSVSLRSHTNSVEASLPCDFTDGYHPRILT